MQQLDSGEGIGCTGQGLDAAVSEERRSTGDDAAARSGEDAAQQDRQEWMVAQQITEFVKCYACNCVPPMPQVP